MNFMWSVEPGGNEEPWWRAGWNQDGLRRLCWGPGGSFLIISSCVCVFYRGKRYAMRLLIMYEYVVYNSFQERGGVFSKFKTKIGNWKRQKVMGVVIWNREVSVCKRWEEEKSKKSHWFVCSLSTDLECAPHPHLLFLLKIPSSEGLLN